MDTKAPQLSGPSIPGADEAVHKERGDSLVRIVSTAASLDAEQDGGNILKTKFKATPNEPSSLGTSSSGGPRCQETMGDTSAQTRFKMVSKPFNDSPLLGVNKPESNEDSMELKELMAFCTYLQTRVLDCENKNRKREQLQALVDRKKVIITETSIRRALKFKDEGRVDCLSNEVIFEQLTLMGMVKNLDSGNKFLMYPRLVQVFLDKQVDGMSQHNAIYVIPFHIKKVFSNIKRENKGFFGTVTPLFPTMMVEAQADIEHVADETANMENVPTESIDPPLSRVNTLGSGEDSLKLIELTKIYTKLSDRVLSLEHIKTTQAAEIKSLKTMDDASKQGRIAEIDADKEFSLINENTKEHGNLNDQDEMMFDVNADLHGEEVVVDKDAKNVQNVVDKVIKDITTVGIEQRELKRSKINHLQRFDAVKKMFDKAYKKVNTSVDMDSEVVEMSKNTKAEVTEGSSKRPGNELEQESSKRQRLEDDDDFAQLKKNLEIVPDDGDDVTVDATSLSSKSQTIVDYKIHKEGRKSYYQSSEQMVILK
nr:hypothetical protein [Tanacetum cinerariifolium]